MTGTGGTQMRYLSRSIVGVIQANMHYQSRFVGAVSLVKWNCWPRNAQWWPMRMASTFSHDNDKTVVENMVPRRPIKLNIDCSNEDEFNRKLGQERILYIDDDIVVVEKPENVQTTAGFLHKGSIVGNIAEVLKHPNPDQMVVHRLDYATSGIVVLARNIYALRQLQEQFRKRDSVKKVYFAIVSGVPTNKATADEQQQHEGIVDLPITKDLDRGSPFNKIATEADKYKVKPSLTHWKVLESVDMPQSGKVSLMELTPRTGRWEFYSTGNV